MKDRAIDLAERKADLKKRNQAKDRVEKEKSHEKVRARQKRKAKAYKGKKWKALQDDAAKWRHHIKTKERLYPGPIRGDAMLWCTVGKQEVKKEKEIKKLRSNEKRQDKQLVRAAFKALKTLGMSGTGYIDLADPTSWPDKFKEEMDHMR